MEILLSPLVLLTLAVIFVNGWTDAPNAIATAVGTGALRKAVHQLLKRHPYIKSFRLGVFGEGEDGVTVAELK